MLQALPGYPCGPEPKRVVQLEVSCSHDTDQSGWVRIIEGTLDIIAKNVWWSGHRAWFPDLIGIDSASAAEWTIANKAPIAERFPIAPNCVLLRAPVRMAA